MNKFMDSSFRSPWHDGEVALQKTVGVADEMQYIGPRAIRDHLIDQHRIFFAQLPYAVIATVDSNGSAWATLLAGNPGFLQVSDSSTLRVMANENVADPAWEGLSNGNAIGLLGIDLRTRRRTRLNGRIHRDEAGTFDITVEQSFGNCPRYIHQRTAVFARDPLVVEEAMLKISSVVDARAAKMIQDASTFFIASFVDLEDGSRQLDVSHKGGKPGFVHVNEDGVVTIPDFAGNLYFNTLGNILVNPGCGLVFVDFTTGDLLQLTGNAEIIFDSPEMAAFHGAERLVKFSPIKVVFRSNALPLRWESEKGGMSPSVATTGSWEKVTK